MPEIHKESQGTYDFIADWITPNFFYSKKDVWHRFGMLAVFGDFVLSCTQGAVMEIGSGESSIYLSHVSRKYGRKFYTCDIAPGKIVNPSTVNGYFTPEATFLDPKVTHVEHQGVCFYLGASDEFFRQIDPKPLALTFIDGDHLYEQVKKDFFNAVSRTVDNGYILLHDTYPPSAEFTREERCGTVYRLRQEIEKDNRFDIITLPVGCAVSVGLSIVRKKPAIRAEYQG